MQHDSADDPLAQELLAIVRVLSKLKYRRRLIAILRDDRDPDTKHYGFPIE